MQVFPSVGDRDLLASLAQARTLHLKADSLSLSGDADGAIKAVHQVLTIEFPEGVLEAEDIKNDARARLAAMHVTVGEFSAAQQVLAEGFAQATRNSFFVANLHTAQGQLFEARAVKENDLTEQKKFRRKAILSYERSQKVNTELQKKLDSKP